MSNRISRAEAIAMIRDWQAENVRPAEIRRRMMDEGFSFSEIHQMMDENQYSHDKPKRKNDDSPFFDNYGKQKNVQYYETFERGGCLSAYLIFQGVAIVLAFLLACSLFADASSFSRGGGGFINFLVMIVFVVGGIQLMCINWLWNGQRKGYHGLMILLGISVVLNLFSGDFPQLAGNFVGLAILVSLVNPKSHLLT